MKRLCYDVFIFRTDRISVQHYTDADVIGSINAGPGPHGAGARRLEVRYADRGRTGSPRRYT